MNPGSLAYNAGDSYGSVVGTSLEYFTLFCGISAIAMSTNNTYIKGYDDQVYFPLFYISVCVGIAALSNMLVHMFELVDESEDHLYVEN